MRLTYTRAIILFSFAAAALASACGGCGDEDIKQTAERRSEDAAAIGEFDAGSIHTETITPEVLLPVIQAIGFHGVTPRRVTAQFSRNVIDDAPRAAGEDTLFEITPATPGSLRFTSNSTLEFEPRDGFTPDTTYKVSIGSVDSRKGAQIPASPWTHAFTTPPFAFIGLSGAFLDEKAGQVELDMRFSAPVDPTVIAQYATWHANGRRIGAVTYSRGSEAHVVRAFLRDTNFGEGGILSVELDEGVPYGDGSIRAEGGEAQVEIEVGRPVNLYKAIRKEGPQGHYIEIVCRDESAPGGDRYYYDRTNWDSYRVSRRCLPREDEIASSIVFNPPVKFRVGSGEGGFNLIGDFRRGNYALEIKAGLRTIDGGIVRSTFEQEITIPSRSPQIDFVDKGRYVPRSEWKRLAVNHLNVDEVEISVRHVPERNAIFWMSGPNERADARTSTLVARERVKFTAKTDERATSFVDVERLVGEPERGIYEVTVAGLGQTDAIRLVPTDLNLVVKRSATAPKDEWASEALVWAFDMKSLAPVGGVRIDLVRPSGESLATCDTDAAEGGCRLSIPTDTLDNTPPFAIVARKGEDFTYARYDDLQTQAVEAEVAGEPYLAESAYHASLWSDRGVYRPGETAHLVAVLRNDGYAAPPDALPVEFEIKDPRQRTLTKTVLKTNPAGVVTLDQEFADFATTGFYNVELRVGKKTIARHRFNVEEFVPERMKVSATTPTKEYAVGEEITVDVQAEYLFGGSAEGSNVELTCQIVPETFEPAENNDYFYGLASEAPNALTLQPVTTILDGDGTGRPSCPPTEYWARLNRTGRVEATAAVFEAGSGRTTTAMAKATLHPARYYIGLKSNQDEVATGKKVTVEGIVVDWTGRPTNALDEVEIQFMRLEREYWWYYDDSAGESSYGRNIRPVVEGTRKVAVKNGRFRVDASPGEHASAWVVAAVAPNTRTELEFRMHGRWSYYWEDGVAHRRIDETPRPSRPTSLRIEGPDEIRTGSAATFQIDVPFPGRMLVTTESFEILTHEWVDVKAGRHEHRLQLAEFAPNVYVSALLVKDPHAESTSAFMPDRAYGVKSVRVEPSDKLHGVELLVPNEVRPHEQLTVELNIGPRDGPTFATVAAIDEGILSLTRYESPDPSRELFKKRALGVDTFETVGWALQSSPGGPSSKTGGGWDEEGEFGDGKGRIMPIKPVALWSGLVEVPESGRATVTFEVPRYRGALRVMAVTADPHRTGAADARVVVREPIVLQTTLPRFLAANDEIQVPVFVTNMTGKNEQVKVTMEVAEESTPGLQPTGDGPIVSMRGPVTKTLSIADGKSQTAVFAVRGLRQAGTAKFVVRAESPSYTAVDEGIVPFRPNGPHERIQTIIRLGEGTTDLAPILRGWVPTSETTNVWVTSVPYGEAFSHLKYLIRYPYGCVEQTTSATRPLLYVQNLIGLVDPETVEKAGGIERMVKAGVDRVLSMQTSSGGFAYWPGGTSPQDWATAYVTHMLIDAQKAGFDVPQDRIDKAIDYLEDSVQRRTSSSGIGYKHAEPYMHYVLARAGKGHKARIQRLIDQLTSAKPAAALSGQDAENEYLLKAALWLAGDRRYEKELRSPDVSSLNDERDSRWTYYSDRRRRGFVLSLFHDMFGAHSDGEALVKVVANGLTEGRSSRYYSTQEIMWGVTGLGKWIEGSAANFGDVRLVVDGKRPRPEREVAGRADRSWSIYRLSEYDDVALELQNKKGTVYAVITSEGVRDDGEAKTGGEGLTLSRRYYDAEGNQLEPTHELGALIYTEVTLHNNAPHTLYNLALVDRLPAGWEIENPRLGRGTLPDWVDEQEIWQPEHMNIRDDRIEAFGTLPRDATLKVIYAVRAVSAGEFFAPPAEMSGMYEPEFWARDEPVNVTVRGPWDALVD